MIENLQNEEQNTWDRQTARETRVEKAAKVIRNVYVAKSSKYGILLFAHTELPMTVYVHQICCIRATIRLPMNGCDEQLTDSQSYGCIS
eukprot:scaffold168970_cov30-Prasinocladus_malaysianus.AAC.1